MTSTPIIDIHVHSTLKPYGNSFYENTNVKLTSSPACIWFQDKFTVIDTVYEGSLGIPRYRQSDFKSLVEGQIQIICISLYPTEKEFFNIRPTLLNPLEKWLLNFASLLGKKRIEYVKSDEFNYFQDLLKEYEFLKILDDESPIDSSKKYKIIASSEDLVKEANILIVPTIEGGHVFCNGNDTKNPSQWSDLKKNIDYIKSGVVTPPFFITFAHHFYNGLCTHAKSFYDLAGKLADQTYGMRNYDYKPKDNEPPITPLGYQALEYLLSMKNGKRIYIDVKHMSLEARKAYYNLLEQNYHGEDIPVIWSHGAVDFDNKNQINFSLDIDVKKIYQTGGLIGIEIDQRILGYNKNRFWKSIRNIFTFQNKKEKIAYREASIFWKQIITIAEYAYSIGYTQNPWQCIALGSDYDGIINPLNSYRDATSLSILYQNLIRYLNYYWSDKTSKIPKSEEFDAEDIIYQIMYKNAYRFILKYY